MEKHIRILQITNSWRCQECKSRHGESCLNKFQRAKLMDENLTHNCYQPVYSFWTDSQLSDEEILEIIFRKFNINKPADFKGHSLSVSDIIAINGVKYYCDNVGFKELTGDFEITFQSHQKQKGAVKNGNDSI